MSIFWLVNVFNQNICITALKCFKRCGEIRVGSLIVEM